MKKSVKDMSFFILNLQKVPPFVRIPISIVSGMVGSFKLAFGALA